MADIRRNNFIVEGEVIVYLMKERFLVGIYKTLMMKKFDYCKFYQDLI